MERVVIIRFGELGLKGKNRPVFEDQLRERLRYAVRDLEGIRVRKAFGRFYVEVEEHHLEAALARLRRVFGVVSISPALRVEPNLEAIKAAALAELEAALDALPQGRSRPVRFKVETNRADKRFPLSSQELTRELGRFLLRRVRNLTVDVHNPEVQVSAEIREGQAYLYTRTLPGPGGLPYGSSGKACLLLSGGIDSPVAGWMAMKRGVRIEPIHFHSFPFTSKRSEEKVLDLARVLAGWAGPIRVHLVSVTEIQKEIRQHCPEDLHITILRRFMFRIAERIAREVGALALVTGESVGQVASQTLESMDTIEAVTSIPVLRPLVAMDKAEIIALAREIGTYELSILPYEDCCTIFVPRSPKTRPRRDQAERAEARLDVEALVAAALASREVVEVRPDDPRSLAQGAAGPAAAGDDLFLPLDLPPVEAEVAGAGPADSGEAEPEEAQPEAGEPEETAEPDGGEREGAPVREEP
ncbi:MAG: tRNA uracil 4-sulfurtransferase ThiI [Bacillota bacterium]